jgi:hypothetical protein
LQLKPEAYADFGVAPVPVPVRLAVVEGLSEPGGQLTAEVMAREIVVWVGERPHEYEVYRPLLGELAYSLGTDQAMAGEHERAVYWLEQAVRAWPGDVRPLGNLAMCLARSGRFGRALAICEEARKMPLDARARLYFGTVEKDCLEAFDRSAVGSPAADAS